MGTATSGPNPVDPPRPRAIFERASRAPPRAKVTDRNRDRVIDLRLRSGRSCGAPSSQKGGPTRPCWRKPSPLRVPLIVSDGRGEILSIAGDVPSSMDKESAGGARCGRESDG